MKIAICYASLHHQNTLRLLEGLRRKDVDLIDVRQRMAFRVERYDAVGFASGIYHGSFHESALLFARQYCPAGKPVFFLYTCHDIRRGCTDAIRKIAEEKGALPVGECGFSGFPRPGSPERKSRPDQKDIEEAQRFLASLFPEEREDAADGI